MGFLDRAKKLAEQAKGIADQAKDLAEGALSEAKARTGSGGRGAGGGPSSPAATDPRFGTAYVPGMFGRPGWREKGLTDPAAVLPIADRDRAGISHTTKSEIVEEPYGMGRRWTAEGRSAGLFYPLYPEHQGWEPPGGRSPVTAVPGATQATLSDGRNLVFLGAGDRPAVLETDGLDAAARTDLVRAVLGQLEA